MAINKNHEFEELDNVKCSIVEKNASKERVEFLRSLLEFNGYKVVVVASPPPKAAPAAKPAPIAKPANDTDAVDNTAAIPATPPPLVDIPATPPPPETFTIGVTDLMFNPTNAIFGRALHTPSRHVVTPAYWEQKETESHDEVPYFKPWF